MGWGPAALPGWLFGSGRHPARCSAPLDVLCPVTERWPWSLATAQGLKLGSRLRLAGPAEPAQLC